MQRDDHTFPGGYMNYGPVGPDLGGYMNYGPVGPDLGHTTPQNPDYLMPFHGVELQPSEICPKNFIIFDQTDNKSRIMYHPAFKQKLTYPSYPYTCPSIDINGAFLQGHNSPREDIYNEINESSSSLKEDTRDIDALLSLEEEEDDDEVNSTARTYGNYNCSSPDSCSNSSYSKSNKEKVSSYTESSLSGCCSTNEDNEKQRRRMKKMVKALRGIVPGADNMTTGALIDEAVTYLKSLKMEVKKLGHNNFRN